MNIAIDGKQFDTFTEANVHTDMSEIARTFSITAETRGVQDIPFRKGQTVEISIEDDRIFTGFVERLDLRIDGDGQEYSISGRDLLADVIDSNLDELGDIGLTVEHIAKVVLRKLGIAAKVIDLANTKDRPFESHFDIVAPEPSDTAGEFLKSIARRRQVLLTSDGFGNLVITQGIGLRVDGRVVHRVDQVGNNIEAMEYVTDDSQRFGIYTTDSQLNLAALASQGNATPVAQIVGTTAAFRDPAIRETRRRSVASESSYPLVDASQRARWEANLSRAEGTQYAVTMSGFRNGAGELWMENTAPIIQDEFAGINGRMLIKSVDYKDGANGETVRLSFTEPGAFQAQLALLEGQDLG